MSQDVSHIAGVKIQKGTYHFRMPVGELADGSSIGIPVIVVQGEKAEPVLYLQAAIHGDEVTGTEVARRVATGLHPDRLTGTLIAVPIANVPAYLTRTRGFILEERGPINMTGCFPGNPKGLLSERIGNYLFKEILLKSQYVIDLHSGLSGAVCYPFTYVVPSDEDSKTLATRIGMARASGFPLVFWLSLAGAKGFRSGAGEYSKTFGGQAEAHGIARTILEMGEGGRLQEEWVTLGVRGVMNIMKYLGMIEGRPEGCGPQRCFSSYVEVLANRGGLLNMKARLGQELKEGDLIAEVSDPFSVVEVIVAPVEGVLLRHLNMSIIYPGAEVAWIARIENDKKLKG